MQILAEKLAEKRNLVASFFFAALLAVAFQEAVDATLEVVRDDGLSGYNLSLFFVLFLNVTRFSIGNIEHLTREQNPPLPDWLWRFDFIFISIQFATLIFLGGVASVPKSRAAHPAGFYHYLLFLYGTDVLWLATLWVLGQIKDRRLKHSDLHWGWAILNGVLGVSIWAILQSVADPYSVWPLRLLVGLGVVGFVIDIFVIDTFYKEETKAMPNDFERFMRIAIEEAQLGLKEGGIPIGSALVADGVVAGQGHNRRVQESDPTAHAEIDCLRNAKRRTTYRGVTLYSTLMPCYLCAGAAVQFGIKTVVVGESKNFPGARAFMESHGIQVIDLDLQECREMMARFIKERPDLWNEDIGVDG